MVITPGEEDQEVGRANQRSTSERKTSGHHRDREITEKKIEVWIWPANDEPESAGVVITGPLDPLKFVNAVGRSLR